MTCSTRTTPATTELERTVLRTWELRMRSCGLLLESGPPPRRVNSAAPNKPTLLGDKSVFLKPRPLVGSCGAGNTPRRESGVSWMPGGMDGCPAWLEVPSTPSALKHPQTSFLSLLKLYEIRLNSSLLILNKITSFCPQIVVEIWCIADRR